MKALTIQNLHKQYAGGVTALKGIDLEVDSGDFFALLGPNGAGKSTIIGIISSLVNKTQGKVAVFGHDIDSDLESLKSCIGLVPQEFNFSVFEKVINIVTNQGGYYGLERELALRRAEKYLRRLELWDKRDGVARTLSGGMKRRLMIARALVHEPKLLILDEPTAGVDIEIRRSMWTFLRDINQQGTTIILTTHYLEEAENLCRNIAIIDQGLIIEDTSMKRLLSQLHIETFLLDTREEIVDVPELDGYTLLKIDAHTLAVDVAKEKGLNRLFIQLSDHGITILSLRNKTNRLEELFMNMVNENKKPDAEY
ncbi:daunorubicin/doxorubicin resistance ATP-binding protein DrrA [bacterium BMS3Bbin11]|nr:daunorubicin/doxorubicin resistance ATP-binding protein DrrA [bacterium BMS3Abin11]GBE45848.1 daunorubicin/doxorubicin resistance ATP-binding protein DrrA [bacterium BMS3Bbin11]HDH16479.1 ABC transporter ATP-binding protein [Gammaproteobacteria bacterium]HDZ77941.1 ABC transporter ATP-binding protein [Gammaproteobacteria bacterium]